MEARSHGPGGHFTNYEVGMYSLYLCSKFNSIFNKLRLNLLTYLHNES